MHLDAAWTAALGIGTCGAGVLTYLAAVMRREVSSLRDSMLELRVDPRRSAREQGVTRRR